MKRICLPVGDMTCPACEEKVRAALAGLRGVEDVKLHYAKAEATVRYDPEICDVRKMGMALKKAGYRLEKREANAAPAFDRGKAGFAAAVLVLLLAAYLLLRPLGVWDRFNLFPEAQAGMGYGALFLVGLFTSVHCVAMCGGLNLSQTVREAQPAQNVAHSLRPALLYNAGRVAGYTLVGALVGALGSVVSFSGALAGVVQLAAGVFMVIMGLNMLNLFPGLRRFVPRLPASLARRLNRGKQGKGPLVVGLLNALMPCGPLQAMQLYALSTGSPVKGALSMLVFALGTVPLLFALGAAGSLMTKKFAGRVLTVGAVLVVVLGVGMLQNGLALSGVGFGFGGGIAAEQADGVQYIESTLDNGRYPSIEVEAGTPVRWNLHVEEGELTACNYMLALSEYEQYPVLQVGDNIIEFTPGEAGTYVYSCWMGMLRGTIYVV